MKWFYSICFAIVFCSFLWGVTVRAEESKALAMQDESGRPLSGIGWLSQLDLRKGIVCINDFTFTLTSTTKYLTDDDGLSTAQSFSVQDLVRFQANENGEIVSLWPYRDVENEYSVDKPSEAVEHGTKKIKDRLIKENGVWKNY